MVDQNSIVSRGALPPVSQAKMHTSARCDSAHVIYLRKAKPGRPTDWASADDCDVNAGHDTPAPHGMHAHGQRFTHGALLVADARRELVAEARWVVDVLRAAGTIQSAAGGCSRQHAENAMQGCFPRCVCNVKLVIRNVVTISGKAPAARLLTNIYRRGRLPVSNAREHTGDGCTGRAQKGHVTSTRSLLQCTPMIGWISNRRAHLGL